jgi:hypothetical protein
MRVGIVCRYCSSSATLAALSLARVLTQLHVDVRLYSRIALPAYVVDPDWDMRVTCPPCPWQAWAGDCDCVIWSSLAFRDEVVWARRKNLRTALVVNWTELSPNCESDLRQFHVLLSPVYTAAIYLRSRLNLEQTVFCPWVTGLPVVTARRPPGGRQILLPGFDLPAPQQLHDLCQALEWLLVAEPTCQLLIPLTPSRCNRTALRQLVSFSRMHGERVRLEKGIPLHARPLCYSRADLTLIGRTDDDYGLDALLSLTMGTPVVGYDCPPWSEMMCESGVRLAACKRQFTSRLAPLVAGDAGQLVTVVMEALQRPLSMEGVPAQLETRASNLSATLRHELRLT